MSTEAVVMMVVAMAIIWGGLALALVNLVRQGAVESRTEQPRPDSGRTARG